MIRRYWKYKTRKIIKFTIPKKYRSTISLLVGDRLFGIVNVNGEIMILPGYAWDGCSPKYILFNKIVVGTPDTQELYYPSLRHDILCQFKGVLRLNQADIDKWFLDDMKKFGVGKIRRILYYKAVRLYQNVIEL